MRIVHVTNYHIPGYGYEEIYLGRAQRDLGHEVSIVTSNYLHPTGAYSVLSRRFPQRQVPPSEEDTEGVRVIRLPSHEFGARVWLRGLERRIANIDPDIVHCHNVLQFHPPRLALMKAIRRAKFQLVVDEHMQTSVMRRSVGGLLFYRLYGSLMQPAIGHYVAHYSAKNDDAVMYMRSACGIRRSIDVISLGVDIARFTASSTRRAEFRRLHGIPGDAIVYLYTGKVVEPKGPHLLVEAALRLLNKGRSIHIVLLGDADERYLENMRQRVTETETSLNFHFLPSVTHDELPSAYAGADIGVWPRQESMALFEALSAEVPVIINAASGYALAVQGRSGLLFDPENVDSLAEAMDRFTSESLRKVMGASGRELVEKTYSWRLSAERYLAVYEKAIRHNHEAPA
jgi:glycosyltransferase involved in cell wall biosynthesis